MAGNLTNRPVRTVPRERRPGAQDPVEEPQVEVLAPGDLRADGTRAAIGQPGVVGPGRPKGSKNKINQDVRNMVLIALDLAGKKVVFDALREEGMPKKEAEQAARNTASAVDYLLKQAFANPTAFMALVKATMPKQVDVDLFVLSKELVNRLSQGRDQLARMRNVTPGEVQQLEHQETDE